MRLESNITCSEDVAKQLSIKQGVELPTLEEEAALEALGDFSGNASMVPEELFTIGSEDPLLSFESLTPTQANTNMAADLLMGQSAPVTTDEVTCGDAEETEESAQDANDDAADSANDGTDEPDVPEADAGDNAAEDTSSPETEAEDQGEDTGRDIEAERADLEAQLAEKERELEEAIEKEEFDHCDTLTNDINELKEALAAL